MQHAQLNKHVGKEFDTAVAAGHVPRKCERAESHVPSLSRPAGRMNTSNVLTRRLTRNLYLFCSERSVTNNVLPSIHFYFHLGVKT